MHKVRGHVAGEVEPAAAASQLVGSHEPEVRQLREPHVLVPGGVGGPVAQQDELTLDVRVRRLHAAAQRLAQPLRRDGVAAVGRHRGLDRLRRRQAVRAARRGAHVVLEDLEAPVAVADDVEAGDGETRAPPTGSSPRRSASR